MSHNIAGHGLIELQQIANRTAVTQCRASSPLKLLTPRSPGPNAWIFTSTYGGGLVGGDEIDLRIDSGPNTRCLLTTQASTKIYRSERMGCRQSLHLQAAANAVVVSLPDPIACFAGANFQQRQRFELARDAGLVMVDWLTSGRKARGERWAFDRYRSSTEVTVEQVCVFRDVLLLDPADGPLANPMRLGRVDCFATAVIVGLPFAELSVRLLELIAAQPPRSAGAVLFAASPIPGGVVLRAAGKETEEVGHWLKRSLDSVEKVLGQNPWTQKM